MRKMTQDLKERGLIIFLRDYLKLDKDGETPSLRKLLLGSGIIPVCHSTFIRRRTDPTSPVVCVTHPHPTSTFSPSPKLSSPASSVAARSFHTSIPSSKPSSSSRLPRRSSSSPVQASPRPVGSRTFARRLDCMLNYRLRGSTSWTTRSRCLTFITSGNIPRYSSECYDKLV